VYKRLVPNNGVAADRGHFPGMFLLNPGKAAAAERFRWATERTTMVRIVRWLKRVPLWIWLFVAASQVLTLAAKIYDIPDLDEAIQRFGDEPAYAKLKSDFERIRWHTMKDLIGAAILAP
jgi:hypothetical protein